MWEDAICVLILDPAGLVICTPKDLYGTLLTTKSHETLCEELD